MLDQSELDRYLAKIEDTFGIEQLLSLRADREAVLRYYNECARGYRVFHSNAGSLHMTMTLPGSPTPDCLGQARVVQQHVRGLSARKVLELGCGKGFNLSYLARLNPDAELAGVDLTPYHVSVARGKCSRLRNVRFLVGDFQTLDFGDGEFDLIYEVEALCHAQDAASAFREVYRVLRPGGRVVLFNGFRAPNLSSFSEDLQVAVRLVDRTMAVREFPSLDGWLSHAGAAGFKVLSTEDLSDAVMPNLVRFQRLARGFYKFPSLNKRLVRMLPASLVKNSVAGLLMPFTVGAGAHRYFSLVLEKAGA